MSELLVIGAKFAIVLFCALAFAFVGALFVTLRGR
jgi:hypothetical protein